MFSCLYWVRTQGKPSCSTVMLPDSISAFCGMTEGSWLDQQGSWKPAAQSRANLKARAGDPVDLWTPLQGLRSHCTATQPAPTCLISLMVKYFFPHAPQTRESFAASSSCCLPASGMTLREIPLWLSNKQKVQFPAFPGSASLQTPIPVASGAGGS